MNDTAIRVQNISKSYQLGARFAYGRFSEVLQNAVLKPVRRFRSQQDGAARLSARQLWALDDVSFEIRRGEAVGIVGRNGAGKSTLLKILSRITHPTRGRLELRGRVGSLLEVGTGFHPELTGRENIFLNGAILGMTRREIRRRFDEIVAFAEIERFLDTPVKHYSSGMYVRLAFAVAAHLEPEILAVDEVLAVGDVAFQRKCLDKMNDVGRQGRTILLVSHNLPLVMNTCTRAILLDSGRLLADGPATSIVEQYLAMGAAAAGETRWTDPETSPGTAVTRLHAVRVCQGETDEPTADVDISKEIRIQLVYWNLQDGAELFAGMWLKDRVGTTVFSTAAAPGFTPEDDEWYGRPHPVGLFLSECRVPGNFLNEGLYSVTALVNSGAWESQVRHEDAVSFRVHDTGAMRSSYYGEWIGVVRPQLHWTTSYLGPAA